MAAHRVSEDALNVLFCASLSSVARRVGTGPGGAALEASFEGCSPALRSTGRTPLVRYRREGVEPLSFTLSETAEFEDAGRIVLLRDDSDAGQDHVARWLEDHRDAFDPSYR